MGRAADDPSVSGTPVFLRQSTIRECRALSLETDRPSVASTMSNPAPHATRTIADPGSATVPARSPAGSTPATIAFADNKDNILRLVTAASDNADGKLGLDRHGPPSSLILIRQFR